VDDARLGPADPAPMPTWKRRLRTVWRLSLVATLLASPWWGRALLQQMDFFRVRRVELEGVRYAAPDEIVSRLRVDTTASIWDDVSPLEARVQEHPQVRTVRIKRKLPGTLVVVVTEKPPVALVSTPRGLVVTDAAGDSLPVDPTSIDVLLLRLLGETQLAEPALFARVSEVRRVERGGIVFVLTDFRILADSTVTTQRLADVIPVEIDATRRNWQPREFDVRFRDQVIVRLQAP
jgi:cell division protein FtsQ